MTEGEYPRVSDARLVGLGDIARTNEKRGYALSIHERAYLDLADARALLRDAAEHLMWADAAIQRAEEVPDTPERVVDLLEGARAEIIALRARIEGGGVVMKYRKKPVEVEAMHIGADSLLDVARWRRNGKLIEVVGDGETHEAQYFAEVSPYVLGATNEADSMLAAANVGAELLVENEVLSSMVEVATKELRKIAEMGEPDPLYSAVRIAERAIRKLSTLAAKEVGNG